MSDDSKKPFSLGGAARNVRRRASELAGEQTPAAKSIDSTSIANRPFTVEYTDYDRVEAPKDEMRQYWRQFETTPLLRKPITSFASQVVEPGYYVDGDISDEDRERLEKWLSNSAILEAEKYNDFLQFAKKTVVQREVRGTVLIEKVPDRNDDESLAAFKLINPETMEVLTHPNQSLLIEPDDFERFEDVPTTEDGKAATYLQDISETGETRWGTPIKAKNTDSDKIGFAQDEIIKIARDADIGEPYGTSRIESVSDRVEGLKQKLSDNDEAIKQKAYPLWLFLFGDPENTGVWDRNDIDSFMSSHEMENFHPGMKQGVRGDVSVETISGEVADIAQYLQFDIDYILTSMPMPKYALGGFADTVGQVAGMAQQQNLQRQIRDARNDIESKFSPAVQQKAEELGIDNADSVELKIGDPEKPDDEGNTNQQIINYLGVDDDGGQGTNGSSGNSDSEEEDLPPEDEEENAPARAVWDQSNVMAELSSSTVPIDDDSLESVADAVYSAFVEARDHAMKQVGRDAERMPQQMTAKFPNIANTAINNAVSNMPTGSKVRPVIRNELGKVGDVYGAGYTMQYTNEQDVSHYSRNVENATRDALDKMMRDMRREMRRTIETNGSFEDAQQRVSNKYTDGYLRSRAELISHMELLNATESKKMTLFEQRDDVVGVRVSNDEPGTPICGSLQNKVAYFDEGQVSAQLAGSTRNEFMHKGFDPLPETPPFHMGCNTVYEPVYKND